MSEQYTTTPALDETLSARGLTDDAPLIAEAIVDTVREPLLLLDSSLKVVLANRSFYLTFGVQPAETLDRMVYDLGNGQWNIPRLRELLEGILPRHESFMDFKVEHIFPGIGRKVMVLNARKLRRRDGQEELILLAIEDRTALHDREERLNRLLEEKQVLLREIHHRVKNNLQIVSSLLSLQSAFPNGLSVAEAFAEAQDRVDAIARVHESLYASSDFREVNIGSYVRTLIDNIQRVHGRPEIKLEVTAGDFVLEMERVVPLGLIVNELVVNSFKHAFPLGRAGCVRVSIQSRRNGVVPSDSPDDSVGVLQVEDDGAGFPSGVVAEKGKSLGMTLVDSLTKQLGGALESTVANGVKWTVTFPLPAREGAGFKRSELLMLRLNRIFVPRPI